MGSSKGLSKNRSPYELSKLSAHSLEGVSEKSTGNLLGFCLESAGSLLRVGWESAWSPLGVRWESAGSPLEVWILSLLKALHELSKLRPGWSPLGVLWESSGSPLGVRWESAGSPLGVCWESANQNLAYQLYKTGIWASFKNIWAKTFEWSQKILKKVKIIFELADALHWCIFNMDWNLSLRHCFSSELSPQSLTPSHW